MLAADHFEYPVDTQAEELRQEVAVEEVPEDDEVWAGGEESGLVFLGVPPEGSMIRIRVSGHAVLYRRNDGTLVLDPRPP